MIPHVIVGLNPFLVDVNAVNGTDQHAHWAAGTQFRNDHDVESAVEYGAKLRWAAADTRVTGYAFRRLNAARRFLPRVAA